MSDQIIKDDADKLRFDLLPADAMEQVVRAMMAGLTDGRQPHDWAKGADWSRYWNAAQRHMWAWHSGEDADGKSGVHHLAHAAASNLISLAYVLRGLGADDRPR